MDVKLNPEKFRRVERLYEFSTYFVVIFSCVGVYFSPDPSINRTLIYSLAVLLLLYSFVHYHFFPTKFQVGGKTLYRIYFKEVLNVAFMTLLIHFTGPLGNYFFFLYFISLVALTLGGTLFEAILVDGSIVIFYSLESFYRLGPSLFHGENLLIWILRLSFIIFFGIFVRFLAKEFIAEREEKEKMKQFISLASHELRTPITVINGYLSLAQEQEKDEKIKKLLGQSQEASIKLNELINNILDLSSEERPDINLKKVNLNKLIEEEIFRIKDIAKEKGIKIIFNPLSKELSVKVIPEQIKKVLNYVLQNALKFTEKGSITIETNSNKKEIITKITDTGAGISENDLPHIFEEFYCTEDVITRDKGGFGLGLAVSKKILENVNGKIWAESEKGKGSSFFFSLPKT